MQSYLTDQPLKIQKSLKTTIYLLLSNQKFIFFGLPQLHISWSYLNSVMVHVTLDPI